MDSHEQNRAFAPLAISLLFLATTIPAWPQSGTSLGLRSGGLIGNTELTDKAHVQTALTLRRPLLGMLLWELGAGYSRLDGTDYAANLAVGELRLLAAKRSGKMRPVLYAGAGATRYNLATSPPGRTPDIEGLGVAVTVPVGLGFQWVLGGSKALEILGGYTYTMKDDINGAIHEQGNDVFYGVTIGLTFGNFGPRAPARPVVAEPEPTPEPVAAPALEAQPAVEASPAPEAVAAEPAVAAVPVAAAEPAPQAVEATPATGTDLSFAPTYFATGSATLSPNGRSLISEIAKTVERLDEIVLLEVRGYADARGARNWNRSLARKRAEAVKAALVEEGIAVWRIRAVAVGETEPVQGQVWRGRRVEIVELE